MRIELLHLKNQPVHIFSRAVEKRKIFKSEECYRFVFQMFAANVGRPAFNLYRRDIIKAAQALLSGEKIPSKFIIIEHPPLVHYLSFVEVIDHYHLFLIENLKNGIPQYMKKLNIGFAKYYNLKHNRKGTLFESRYKIVPAQNDFQSENLINYINIVNPLDVYQWGWRGEGLKNKEKALQFLNEYQFSSFPDLFGERNSKILAPKEVLEKYLGKIMPDRKERIDFVKNYLENFSQENMFSFRPLFLGD